MQERTCVDCGADIMGTHGNTLRCRPCAYVADNRPRQVEKACPWCKALFTANGPRIKFCSPRCSGIASRARQLSILRIGACVVCAEQFTATDVRQVTCSTRCRIYSRRHPGFVDVARACIVCNASISLGAHRAQVYCQERCRRLLSKHERRNRVAGGETQRVLLSDVFARDGWTCHICHEPVDMTLDGHHPMMASLDHIIPVSHPRYPGHVWHNLALAHLVCNMSKHNRVTAADWDLFNALKERSLQEA